MRTLRGSAACETLFLTMVLLAWRVLGDRPLSYSAWLAYVVGTPLIACPQSPCTVLTNSGNSLLLARLPFFRSPVFHFRWKPSHCSVIGNVLPSYLAGRSIAATGGAHFVAHWYPHSYIQWLRKEEPDGCRIMWQLPAMVLPPTASVDVLPRPTCDTPCSRERGQASDWVWMLHIVREEIRQSVELATPLIRDPDLSAAQRCPSQPQSCNWDVVVHFRCGDIRRSAHGAYGFLSFKYYTHVFQQLLHLHRPRVLILTNGHRHLRRGRKLLGSVQTRSHISSPCVHLKDSSTVVSDCSVLVRALGDHLLQKLKVSSVQIREEGSIDADFGLMLVGARHFVASISTFSMLAGLLRTRGVAIVPRWPALYHQLGTADLQRRVDAFESASPIGNRSTKIIWAPTKAHGRDMVVSSVDACKTNICDLLAQLQP